MTIVVACHFGDSAIILADSRATWSGSGSSTGNVAQDTLRKLLPVGPLGVFAYAGSVDVAAGVYDELRRRGRFGVRRTRLRTVATDLPRIARRCIGLVQAKHPTRNASFAFIFGGAEPDGSVRLWQAVTPGLELTELIDQHAAVGSGTAGVAAMLAADYGELRATKDHKVRTDMLRERVERGLNEHGESTIGGLLQIVTIESDGIRPFTYGFASLDPDDPGDNVDMQLVGGNWVQRSMANEATVPLVEPGAVIRGGLDPVVVRNFAPRARAHDTGKWFLSHMIPCKASTADPSSITFTQPVTVIGGKHYPTGVRIVVALGFWGSPVDEMLVVAQEIDGVSHTVHEERVVCPAPLQLINRAPEVELRVATPGIVFLTCSIGNQLLARRPVYFGQFPAALNMLDSAEVGPAIQRLQGELTRIPDARLEPDLGSGVAYWVLCETADLGSGTIRFTHEAHAVFSATHPMTFHTSLVAGLRAVVGDHLLRVDLVDIVSRAGHTIASVKVTSESTTTLVQVAAKVAFEIPRPGWYFVNLYCDNKRIATAMLAAEGVRTKYSYRLLPADIERVEGGEVLVLGPRGRSLTDS